MKCSCWACRAGMPNHCEGPDRAANIAKWRADYENAAAELAFILATGSMPSDDAREQFKQRVRSATARAKQPTVQEVPMMPTQEQIAAAFERAEIAHRAAEKAIDARDAKQAPPLIYETLVHTLEAMTMCARAGVLNPLENITPSVTFYVRVLQLIAEAKFDDVAKLKIGSSIGVVTEPELTPAAPVREGFRCAIGVAMDPDERTVWNAAFAQAMADENTGAVSANFADECVDALRAEMKARG